DFATEAQKTTVQRKLGPKVKRSVEDMVAEVLQLTRAIHNSTQEIAGLVEEPSWLDRDPRTGQSLIGALLRNIIEHGTEVPKNRNEYDLTHLNPYGSVL